MSSLNSTAFKQSFSGYVDEFIDRKNVSKDDLLTFLSYSELGFLDDLDIDEAVLYLDMFPDYELVRMLKAIIISDNDEASKFISFINFRKNYGGIN